ncbi:hypothetical protein AALP_AAs65364U000100 [Arabis alpina]|uniref:Uncharacterized protein n=1 Tax=Arabis alpina TaxID=50452 RepID=A0A087G231_ARAAL|nr:hypothetical protein AALP_AAs65364U000100 [Arabis alpina]
MNSKSSLGVPVISIPVSVPIVYLDQQLMVPRSQGSYSVLF